MVTDHGQKPLSEPSLISHFGQTELELTSFVIGAGPGLGANVKKPKVVDILPTVLHQLGLRTPATGTSTGARSRERGRPLRHRRGYVAGAWSRS